jgi:hypothetical protein
MSDEKKQPKKKNRSGSSKRQRHPRIYARVSAAERQRIRDAAALLGFTVGAYVRALLLGDQQQTRSVLRRLPERQALEELKGLCGRLGGNVYQTMRRLNRSGVYVPELPDTLSDLKKAADAVTEFVALATTALKGA